MSVQKKALQLVPLIVLAICTVGCQRYTASRPARATAAPAAGLAFAQASCGGCHAIGRYGASPNPEAPPFAGIVNQPSLTAETLSSWLRDAHNYPEEMEFYLEAREVDDLVAYMITLRDTNYRPPFDVTGRFAASLYPPAVGVPCPQLALCEAGSSPTSVIGYSIVNVRRWPIADWPLIAIAPANAERLLSARKSAQAATRR